MMLQGIDRHAPDYVGVVPARVECVPVRVNQAPGLCGVDPGHVVCQRTDLSTKHPV